MKIKHIPVFESTVQKTHEWLKDVQKELGEDDPHQAYIFLRGVLHALRDRLPFEVAVKFGAQLPMLIRGFYYEGWKPVNTPIKIHQLDDFLIFAAEYFPIQSLSPLDSLERIVRGVFKVIVIHLSQGEIVHVIDVLPPAIADLWPIESIMEKNR